MNWNTWEATNQQPTNQAHQHSLHSVSSLDQSAPSRCGCRSAEPWSRPPYPRPNRPQSQIPGYLPNRVAGCATHLKPTRLWVCCAVE